MFEVIGHDIQLDNFAGRHGVLRTLKFVAAFAVLTFLAITASSSVHADEGRIHITFFKGEKGSGSGYLFFQGQKYGLGISGTKIGRVWATTIDLIGIVSNLRNAPDIIGTYTAVDTQAATVSRSKVARLENAKGIVVEIRAVNLNRLFSLNLSGMTIKNLGWQPSSE
jgi:hypothetical protein